MVSVPRRQLEVERAQHGLELQLAPGCHTLTDHYKLAAAGSFTEFSFLQFLLPRSLFTFQALVDAVARAWATCTYGDKASVPWLSVYSLFTRLVLRYAVLVSRLTRRVWNSKACGCDGLHYLNAQNWFQTDEQYVCVLFSGKNSSKVNEIVRDSRKAKEIIHPVHFIGCFF